MAETSPAPNAGAKKRTFRGQFIRPQEQLKYSFILVGIGVVLLMVFITAVMVFMTQTLATLEVAYNLDPEVTYAIRHALLTALGVTLLVSTVLATFTVFLGVQWSHRVYGPIIAFKRHIDALKAGDYSSRVNLREKDQLGELQVALNDLASELQTKYGSGRAGGS